MTEVGWKQWKRRRKPPPPPIKIESESPLLLTPEEIRSGAIITYDFTEDGTPVCKIEANTARGLRTFYNFHEFFGLPASKTVTVHLIAHTGWLSGWGPSVMASTTTSGSLSLPPETAEEAEPSAAEVLASLAASDVTAAERRRMILAAEVLRFDASQAEALKPLLRRHIDRHYMSEQGDERVTVASAVRKFIALLSVAELPAVVDLLRAERKAPPAFEMEVAKMVTRKLTATLPENTTALQPLGDELLDLATGYATPRMLPKRYCGAVVLDSMLSLALLRSPHLPSLTTSLRSIRTNWFRATVARQAQALRAELARRFGAERHGQASECLRVLAAAAESPTP
jgi:hypothetical protein